VRLDDRLAVVGSPASLDHFERAVGRRVDDDLTWPPAGWTRAASCDRPRRARPTVGELQLDDRFGVAVTRVRRAGVELTAVPGLALEFGDQVLVVGREADIDRRDALGNSLKELTRRIHPFFIGITLGIALGTLPIRCRACRSRCAWGWRRPLVVALLLGASAHPAPGLAHAGNTNWPSASSASRCSSRRSA
jgi:putative transport protein